MPRRLLLVGWEAADWNLLRPLMAAGNMPALKGLAENGASGALLPVPPPVPAAEWTSLATGKRAWQHGVCHSREIAPGDGNSMVPITARRRGSAALWEILAHAGRRSLVAGWPATHYTLNWPAKIVSDRYRNRPRRPGSSRGRRPCRERIGRKQSARRWTSCASARKRLGQTSLRATCRSGERWTKSATVAWGSCECCWRRIFVITQPSPI